MKTTMSSRKVKSLGREVWEHGARLLSFLPIAAMVSILCVANAGGEVKTYHTDSGGGWTCGSASIGMTGTLTDAPTYNCASDELDLVLSFDENLVIGTWIMTSPYPSATRIQAQDMYLYATFDGAVSEAMYNTYQIGYWVNEKFTPIISHPTSLNRWGPAEIAENLSYLAPGVAPAGSSLALRIWMQGNADGYAGTLHFGNAISPAGYIRLTVNETNDVPTVSPIPGQRAHVDNLLHVPFTVSDENSRDLVLTATSSNQAILPNTNIGLGGGDNRRTITLTPVPGQTGSAIVSIMVSDGTHSATENFTAEWYTPNYIYVNAANTTGIEDGTASNPFNTIQEGIDAALSDAYLVRVAEGTYKGAGNKDLVLDGITLRSEKGPEHTIIDLENSERAFVIQGDSGSTLDGFTVMNGRASDAAGVVVGAGSVITNCAFINNSTYWVGGGAITIFLEGTTSAVLIRRCTFSKNRNESWGFGSSGGAIGVWASSGDEGPVLEISECSFSENTAYEGGAIYTPSSRALIVRNSSFYANVAKSGGAVYANGFCAIINSAFRRNKATENGGAVWGSPYQIVNSTFLMNSASQDGGAVYTSDSSSLSSIFHCTFAENDAKDEGGAIYGTNDMAVCNSVLWGNKANNGGDQICLGKPSPQLRTLTVRHSDLEGNIAAIGISEGASFTVLSPGGTIDLNPGFALREDLHLMPDSPCIDAGSNGHVPLDQFDADSDGNTAEQLPYDGDGNVRLRGEIVDMGAYEFDGAAFPVAAISPAGFVFTGWERGALPEAQTLFIRNRGLNTLGSLKWKVTEEIPWLRVEPAEGASAGEIDEVRLFVDQSQLGHGEYTEQLLISNDTGSVIFGTVPVTLYVTSELHVPADYTTIQEAINAAIQGDIVVVANGTYTGNGNKNLDFMGKAITVKGENGPYYATIDCENNGRAFHFHRSETRDSVLQGFTIKRGNASTFNMDEPRNGGAILISPMSSPTILDCIFLDNVADQEGGAIYTQGASTYIGGCTFLRNTMIDLVGRQGGAISIRGDLTTVENCSFSENSSGSEGGAILILSNDVLINGCTFADNDAGLTTGSGFGGAIIIYGNVGDDTNKRVTSIFNSVFSGNSTNYGGAIYNSSWNTLRLSNSVFSFNEAYVSGGAICGGNLEISHCTFYSNTKGSGGGGGLYLTDYQTAAVKNSIFWNNQDDISKGSGAAADVSFCAIKDSVNWPENPVERIINDDPRFIDPNGPDNILGTDDDDFRLAPESPCIDRGRRIQWLFSDIRGSLRPVDIENMPRDGAGNPVPQDSAFDMGAYEFSGDYGGLEGDLVTKAFKDLKIGGSLAVTNFEYRIQWKDKDPFAYDTRISHPGEYKVNLALVSEEGLRIDLGSYTVPVSQHGYSISYTFGPEHIGTWRIRVELAADPSQYELSDTISIEYKKATRYALSQWIQAPEGADPAVAPDVADEGTCYWSVETNKLYAIAPWTTVITWYADQNREIPIPVVAYITYPDRGNFSSDPATRIHVADSMPVDLLPAGTPFDLVEVKYAGNDATISAGRFSAREEGWSILLYQDSQAANPDNKEKFDVVRTYAWDHAQDQSEPADEILNPAFPIESAWEIGKEITDPDHNPGCGSGYVFLEGARYDGYGEIRAYDRESREGPIFAVNEDDPAREEDDLVVVWYKKSEASGVCWPSKPVRYETAWPEDAKKIVIASELGSGSLPPEQYGPTNNMLIYSQPDRSQPGYNANEEHAAFFTPPDSQYPVVFALRTDLNKPADKAAAYQAGDRSRPYVLLKYQDPSTAEWAFEVFEVVAQSGSYMVQAGQVVPQSGIDTRYDINQNGVVTLRSGDIPANSYYLSSLGLLVKHGDTGEAWYNLVAGSIQPVAQSAVIVYYLNGSGALIAQGLLSSQPGPPPAPSYYLDEHGVIVESDVYYRFHYAGTAGQEITPPYPIDQPAFGPCTDSYTSTPSSVLEDKDNRFHAKHGGFGGEPAEDGILHYFYRLQTGFYYDLDDNGVNDGTAGTCVPWLGVVGGTTEGTPEEITYAMVWPDIVPTLHVGETLMEAKTQEGETVGLPNVSDQCIVNVLFDQSVAEGGASSAKLVDPIVEYGVSFAEANLPQELNPEFDLGIRRWVFKALPEYLQARLTYDGVAAQLKLRGFYEKGTGEPLLLLNTLTQRDIMEISRPFLPDPNGLDPLTWTETIIPLAFRNALYALKSAGDAGLVGVPALKDGEMKAVTAGDAGGAPSYVTLAFNNDAACPGPVTLSVIRVGCPLYRGEIKVIESDDAFDEKVTLRHSGDFGGNPDARWFQWKFLPADSPGIPQGPGTLGETWQDYFNVLQAPGTVPTVKDPVDGGLFYIGALDVTVQGTGEQLLPDRWFSVRYNHDGICDPNLSQWTEPQLYEGWVKRVMKKINLFDQKVKDFHASEVDTLAGMISLAGTRYEGDVALSADPDNLNRLGIIETYHTLLDRAKDLTIDTGNDLQDSNKAILFAANRLAGLYMLLGNEAYADAADPTIGFSTTDGQYGTEAPSIFCYQDQVDSLLEEELALLRGRSDGGVRPFYNRLIWNFTLGDGEVAYKENYNITDQKTDQDGDGVPDAPDGVIDEKDAMVLYPQGHGDAWGHYLTAVKYYYDLLKHPSFTWMPQSEAILVDQIPVEVDYRDERRFAEAAAARARTGAEIVNLTYRRYYIEDPEGQWQGYKDVDPARAWGVDGWSRRAGQGVFFDWVAGNAMLPSEDAFACENVGIEPGVTLENCHDGIQKIDRTTVVELREVASHYAAIQAEVDRADVGLNPLGVAKNAVPFDIDPGAIAAGQTHFEQIYDRAVQAMNNAISVFNHANQSTMLLRRQQDTLADFKRNIENTEADFNNRLIEVFGYPYPDDDTYTDDYCRTGPDLYHYMYVEPSELMGVEAPEVHEFPVTLKTIDVDAGGALQEQEKEVLFHVATDSRFGLIKPPEWQGRRKAPGEIQLARSDLLQTRGRFEKAVEEYNNLLGHIEHQAALIEAQHAVNREEINILNTAKNQQQNLNTAIIVSRSALLLFRTLGQIAVHNANAVAEGYPSVLGVIAGVAAGTIVDATSVVRAAAKVIGSVLSQAMNTAADVQSLAELGMQQAKEMVAAQSNIRLTALHGGFAVTQQLLQLENLIRTEATLRYEIFNLAESMQQAAGRYLAAIARGERLLQDRLRFRKQTAARIQDYRYKDMTFRIFRNDALQKYRAQFDMAARYVYLAAKAYDYETTLLDSSSMAGQAFLRNIVRQRTIGLIEGGLPLTGTGLADPMRRMWQNFQVLKPQLGFNNPQEETNRFSLRTELFRVNLDEGSNATWRQVMEMHRVDDLWDIPEFRRYCRPFADEGIPQPGIVIHFPTTVTSGLNFFEWPLGGRDSYYSATNFATKVRSVGVWFSNYNSVQLTQTPRIYLVPVGEDVLRTPSYYTRDIRVWQVVDQKLPVPFPIVETEMENNPGWIPTVDTLFDEMFQIRRHSDFRAYHDSGYVKESEMTFDSRLVGRSVWNTGWLLIIPGQNLLYDADEGLERFIYGPELIGGTGERTGYGISDIKLFFHTYAYSGN